MTEITETDDGHHWTVPEVRKYAEVMAELTELRQWRLDVLTACTKARTWWAFGWIEELLAVVSRPIHRAR